jgi:hypothetical protein
LEKPEKKQRPTLGSPSVLLCFRNEIRLAALGALQALQALEDSHGEYG